VSERATGQVADIHGPAELAAGIGAIRDQLAVCFGSGTAVLEI
jgi:hypothetical protein